MEPQRRHHAAFAIAGPSVRTTNREESSPATGRIPGLWARFFGENVMGRTAHRDPADPCNYGVYSAYESDAHGAFDVTAGVAVAQGGAVHVEAGDYLVFPAHGPMPQAVLGAWMAVWQYFEAHPRYGAATSAISKPMPARSARRSGSVWNERRNLTPMP